MDGAPARIAPDFQRRAEECAGLARDHREVVFDRDVFAGFERDVVPLPSDHPFDGSVEDPQRAHPTCRISWPIVKRAYRAAVEEITEVDRLALTHPCPQRRTVVTLGIVVLDFVVNQRKVVHELHGHGPGHRIGDTATGGFSGEQTERWPDSFSRSIDGLAGLVLPAHHITHRRIRGSF